MPVYTHYPVFLIAIPLALFLVLLVSTTHGIPTKDSILAKRDNEKVENFIKRLFEGYENLIRPLDPRNSSAPTRVNISLVVNSFGDINVQEMSYTIHIFVRQYWIDPRLRYQNHPEKILLNRMRDRLWLPDLYLPKGITKESTQVYTDVFSMWLDSDGSIFYSQMVTLKLSCLMYLYTFPLDEQLCPLQIGSYAFRETDIKIGWLFPGDAARSVTVAKNISLNEFDLVDVHIKEISKSYPGTGSFSYVIAKFMLSRKLGFYMVYTYLPSLLIIAICWLSFFVDFKAAPARISLSLLSVLSLITQSSATVQKLPRVSYIKAIDVWIFTSLAFVVVSLVEFALINSLCREENTSLNKMVHRSLKSTKMVSSLATKNGGETATDDSENEGDAPATRRRIMVLTIETGYQIDRLFRFIYPLFYILFNIFYWVYYSSSSHETHIFL